MTTSPPAVSMPAVSRPTSPKPRERTLPPSCGSVQAYGTHLIDGIDKHGRDFPAALANAREQLEADR
jgi:hypothetical protein